MHKLLILSAFLALTLVEARPQHQIDYRQQNVKDELLKSLTKKEFEVLRDVSKNWRDYHDEEDFLYAIRGRSPSLYEKAKKINDHVNAKLSELDNESKSFAKKFIADGRKVRSMMLSGEKPNMKEFQESTKMFAKRFNALSPPAKGSLAAHFPELYNFFTSAKIQSLARS